MNNNDQINELVSNVILNINSKYPNTITEEQKQIILNHFISSNQSIEEIQNELNNYANELMSKLGNTEKQPHTVGHSQNELFAAYKNLNDLNKFSNYDLYIDSEIVPYLLSNQTSNRTYNYLNVLIDLKDIEGFRNKLKSTPYYHADLDTINSVKDGNDYGFIVNMEGIPINISPYIKDKDSITKYRFENHKFIVEDIKDTNYLKTYEVNGEPIHSVSLEHLKREKDINQDSEVSQIIDSIGYSYDEYNSIVPSTRIKEVEGNSINNAPSNEIVKNSLINFLYDVKMNDQKDIPDEKLSEAIERLHNKPYDVIKNYLAKAKDKLNNKIELPKVLYDQQTENLNNIGKSFGYSTTKNMATTMIIVGAVICLLAIILKLV